jgi:hypothetical protein
VDITFPCYNRKKQFKLVVKKLDTVFFDYRDVLNYVPQNGKLLTSMSDKCLGAVHCKWLKSGETGQWETITMCLPIQPSQCGNSYANTVFQKQQNLHSHQIWLPVTSFCSLNLRKTKL